MSYFRNINSNEIKQFLADNGYKIRGNGSEDGYDLDSLFDEVNMKTENDIVDKKTGEKVIVLDETEQMALYEKMFNKMLETQDRNYLHMSKLLENWASTAEDDYGK